jgi:hypothetical protein
MNSKHNTGRTVNVAEYDKWTLLTHKR